MSDGRIEYEVRADTSNLGSDLNRVTSETQGHTSKWSSLLQGVGQSIGSFVTQKAIEAAKAVWDLGTSFEDGLAKVSTLVDTSKVDMDTISSGLLAISSAYGLSADTMTEAAYNAISSNSALASDSAGLMAVLEASAKLAAAGFTDIDTAASATLKTMNAYGLGIESVDMIQKVLIQTQNNGITTVGELGNVLSNVTPTAAAMGVEFTQVGAALATMTAQGTPAAQATTQLNSLFAELGKSGTTAQKNLMAAAEGTQYAGMSFQEMMAKGVPLNEVLQMMADYADKNGLSLLDMFSSIEAGKASLAMTGANAQTFTNNLEAMTTESDVVGESFDKVSNTSSVSLRKAMTQLQNVAIQLFQAFSPIITVVLNIISVMVQAIAQALTPFLKAIQPIIDIVALLGKTFTAVFGGVITAAIQLFSNLINNSMQTTRGVFQGLIDFIAGVFTGNWSRAWEGVKNIFSSIMSGLGGLFKAPINAIIDGINSFLRSLNTIKVPDWVPVVGGKGFNLGQIPHLRVGLDYVPDDDFPAMLHRGEAVLTAAEAQEWRSKGFRSSNDGIGFAFDYDRLAASMARLRLQVNGRTFATLVEPYISDQQASQYDSIQRSGFNGIV